ncbi:MAG: penicillin acylase family protein, partial [Myxococcota bacterium]|nr:penicillin acylase family protein [Myxococcota bacterium]
WLTAIEGRAPTEEELGAEGGGVVYLLGTPWVCEDENGDGVITAVSFDYAGLDMTDLLPWVDALGHAEDVEAFRQACRGLVAYSQNLVAIDDGGRVLYTGYQPLPCRGYLDREVDGTWAEGADPTALIDGARYPGFSLPFASGVIEESLGTVFPEQCAVPFDAWPQVVDPPGGYVLTANNDPGAVSHDGSITNDPYYLGGPWDVGFRADAIERGLQAMMAEGPVTVEGMAGLQGERRSSLGEHFTPWLLAAIAQGRSADAAADEPSAILRGLYESRAEAMDAVEERLSGWAARGHPARSGVETFYQSLGPDDGEDAVATMIFNAWFPRVIQGVFDDEGRPGIWQGSGGRVRAMDRLLAGRGEANPGDLASWNADTGESAFFDVLGTEIVERSDAVVLQALVDALSFLEGAGTG